MKPVVKITSVASLLSYNSVYMFQYMPLTTQLRMRVKNSRLSYVKLYHHRVATCYSFCRHGLRR